MDKYERVCDNGFEEDRPPFTVDLLADEMRKHARLPSVVPREPLNAAKWWIARQRPANEQFERPAQATVAGKGNSKRWLTPYADRLIASFRRFLELDQRQQAFVLAAVDDGVWYNGDSQEMFAKIYEKTMEMRKIGATAYRKQAISGLKRLLGAACRTNALEQD